MRPLRWKRLVQSRRSCRGSRASLAATCSARRARHRFSVACGVKMGRKRKAVSAEETARSTRCGRSARGRRPSDADDADVVSTTEVASAGEGMAAWGDGGGAGSKPGVVFSGRGREDGEDEGKRRRKRNERMSKCWWATNRHHRCHLIRPLIRTRVEGFLLEMDQTPHMIQLSHASHSHLRHHPSPPPSPHSSVGEGVTTVRVAQVQSQCVHHPLASSSPPLPKCRTSTPSPSPRTESCARRTSRSVGKC